jgi:hypothetical protein
MLAVDLDHRRIASCTDPRGSLFASRIVRIVCVAVLVSGLSAQVSEVSRQVGLPEDWSHHHVKSNTVMLRPHPGIQPQASRIYYTNQGGTNFAYKATQQGLN